jgi:hypothetical protein
MAVKQTIARHVSWVCTNCTLESGQKNIQTSQSAELHADESGHRVLMVGMITYDVRPGRIETDDPFDPRT